MDWKSGKSSPVVRYYEYNTDRDLCVRTTLDVYLERTEPWRTDQKKQLLLSYYRVLLNLPTTDHLLTSPPTNRPPDQIITDLATKLYLKDLTIEKHSFYRT